MKLKIKVKRINKRSNQLPSIIKKGDWIDLRSSKTVPFKAPKVIKDEIVFDTQLIELGVAMELPKGFEAIMAVRSNIPKMGVFPTNSIGIIDNLFKGDNDEWRLWLTALRNTEIYEGDRICQFRIQLSQKATFLQKLRWLLSSGIEIVEAESLNNPDRQGIGSTGIN